MKKNGEKGRVLTILEMIVEMVQKHANGIAYREWNAGPKCDNDMSDEGFNVSIKCDHEKTGFCYGGSKHNCGTWMDKNGSSDATGNKGIPATPRDGAPIELVAMQYSILTWLSELNAKGILKVSGVKINGKEEIKFRDWALKMYDNFEKCFWIPEDKKDDGLYDINAEHVHRRGVYKDVYKSSDAFTDYQLRPNICVAMSYAPLLFDPIHAKTCL